MTFQPAFEVTRVDSMQWNRTALNFEVPNEVTDDVSALREPLPPEVLEQLRDAIDYEDSL